MTFEELLNGYLDGTLSGGDQAELFHIMSVSPEKRTEFNEYLSVRAIAATDRLSIEPPAEAEQNVLAMAASYGVPSSAVVIPAGESGLSGFLRSAIPYSIAAALLIGGIAGYYLGKSSNNGNSSLGIASSNGANSASQAITPAPPTPIAAAPKSGGGNISTAPASTKAPQLTAGKNTTSAQSHSITPVTAVPQGNTTIPEAANPSRTENSALAHPLSPPITKLEWSGATAPPPAMQTVISFQGNEPIRRFGKGASEEDEFGSEYPYEAEIQQGAAALFPNITAAGLQRSPVFNVFTLRAGYNIGGGTILGIGVGQTSFSLQYSSQPNYVTTITYSQFSSVLYGATYIRQSFGKVLAMTPSALLEFGGSALGPVASAEFSLACPLTGNVALELSALGSGLFYQHESSWNASEKAGFMLGLKTVF